VGLAADSYNNYVIYSNIGATPPALPLATHLGRIIVGIWHISGSHAFRRQWLHLQNRYLRRAVPRLERLIARLQAGPLPPPRRSRASADRRPHTPSPRGPGSHAWLIRLVQPTAQFSGQVEALPNRRFSPA